MKKTNLDKLKWSERFTYVKNVIFEGKDLNQKGSRFQVVKFKPGAKMGHHYNKKTYEIFYIRNGDGAIWLNHKRHSAKEDDIFLCEPGDWHAFKNTGKKEWVILIFKTNEVPDKDIYWK